MDWEVLVDGLLFPEGLAWSESDNTLIVSAVAGGALYRVQVDAPRADLLADTGGCANGCALADDGSILVTQNGNVGGWVQQRLSARYPGRFPPTREMTPGVQRVMADGSVVYVSDTGYNAPNDIAVAFDGRVLLTDPGLPQHDNASYTGGRVMAIGIDGSVEVIADGLFYPNGILAFANGEVVVTERQGVLRIRPDGSRDWIIENIGGRVDGLAAGIDGSLYVAGQAGIQVLGADGRLGEFLPIADANTTNCCFGGPDMTWLFVTDAIAGAVLVCRETSVQGTPVALWHP